MKYIIAFLFLITFVVCPPTIERAIPAEEAFTDIKKKILECIVNDEKASPELKNYAQENLDKGLKETLILTKYRQNEVDRLIIRQCRRKAFVLTSKQKAHNLKIVPKEDIKPKITK